ncbi:reverse transcriptase domain-containing protein [Tanacetum coccineum]
MEQYLALTRGNQAPSVVKPEIGGNVNFKIKSQFMQELREVTFSRNKNDDAHEHVERVLDIVSLFNIPGVSHDAVMLCIFPITLTGAAKRWVDKLPPGTVDSWDLLKKAFIQSIEEAKYGEFERPSPFSNGAKYHVGPPGYYTRMDDRPPIGEKRPNLEELMNKHLEESTRRRIEMEEWVKKLLDNAEINTRNQAASLKNLETQIEQLTKEFHTKAANEINSPSLDQCKAVYADEKTSLNNERHEISIASNKCTQIVQTNDVSPKILPCQRPPKELNPGNFTLPCIIGSLNFYDMADLGASVNVIHKSIFEHLKLARLKKTDMLVEMADLTKRSPIGVVENILVKIDKFLFPSDFVVMNMLNTEEQRRKLRINIEEYDPPMVHIETFEVKRYLFDTGQSFICVTKELMDALPMGRENGSRFRDMIRKEVDSGRRIHRQT